MTYVPTVGSLFSGVGMMDYAFAAAGFDMRFQIEINAFCRKVLTKHGPTYWPNSTLYEDVRGAAGERLGYVDVLIGGFPCQDISVAGTRAGIQAGTRSGLWYEFARLIGEIRPAVVFLENVAAITRRDGVRVITDLTCLGYECRWGVVSASDVGAPHKRERWWCVAFNVGDPNGQRYDGSSAAAGLRPDKDRLYPQDQQEGRDKLHAALGGRSLGYANSRRLEEQHAAALHEREARAFRGPSPNRFSAMDYPHVKRLKEVDPARDGNTGITAGEDASNGIEGGWPPNQPRLDRSPDGPAVRMDRRVRHIALHNWPVPPIASQPQDEPPRMAPGKPNIAKRLHALGNGAIPQIVYPMALYIKGMLKGYIYDPE